MSEGKLLISVKAVDEASAEIARIRDDVVSATGEMSQANEELARSGERATQAVQVSKKELASAIGTITSTALTAVNLYQQFDRLQDMQLQVSKSALALEKAQDRVADIQSKLNKLEAEGKKGTEEYQATMRDLQLAQETAAVASERLADTQENVSERYLTFGLTVVPTVINMVMGLAGAQEALKNVQIALNAAMAANPIGVVAVAIGLLIAALVTAYQTCEPFRNAVNAVGEALKNTLQPAIAVIGEKLSWLWNNVIVPVIGILKQLWDLITGNPILAALFGPITTIAYAIGHWKEVTESLGGALNWFYTNVVKPVADGLLWFYNTVLKPIVNIMSSVIGAISGAGAAITGGAKTAAKTGGATMVPIPKGTWVVEHRSPMRVMPIFNPPEPSPTDPWHKWWKERETRGISAPRIPEYREPPLVHITAAPSVSIHIAGPVTPGVVPVLARETRKAAYEGVSEALRDGLRRKGVKVWRGY